MYIYLRFPIISIHKLSSRKSRWRWKMLSNTGRSNSRINRNYQSDLFTLIARLFLIQQHVHYRQWKALESWSDQMIKDLSYVSRMEEFNHNKVIVKDSKKNEWLWFIIRVSGSAPLFHQHKQHKILVWTSFPLRPRRKMTDVC